MKHTLTLGCLLIAVSNLSFAQDWAKARIEKSPRHLEWVKIKNGKRDVDCYIAYPEVKDKAPAVIVIHEIFGLTDWVRSVTDELAEAGYIAIAPDLLSGMGPKGGGTAELGGRDEVGKAIRALPSDQINADLNAAADYVRKLSSCSGKLAVTGFCWGGARSFHFAAANKDLKAAFVFYGAPPPKEEMEKINCPVYGFYARDDARVTSTVADTVKQMKALGKKYEPTIYDGAGHGFMRAGEDPGDKRPDNKKARDEAWRRVKELLKKL